MIAVPALGVSAGRWLERTARPTAVFLACLVSNTIAHSLIPNPPHNGFAATLPPTSVPGLNGISGQPVGSLMTVGVQ